MSSPCHCVCNQTQTGFSGMSEALLIIGLVPVIWFIFNQESPSTERKESLIITDIKELMRNDQFSILTASSTNQAISIEKDHTADDRIKGKEKESVSRNVEEADSNTCMNHNNVHKNTINESGTLGVVQANQVESKNNDEIEKSQAFSSLMQINDDGDDWDDDSPWPGPDDEWLETEDVILDMVQNDD